MAETTKTEPAQAANQPRPERTPERAGTEVQRAGGEGQHYRGPSELARVEGSPFSFIRRFMNDMDRLFGDFGFGPSFSPMTTSSLQGEAMWEPRVDIIERDGQLVVHADLPGMREQDVHIHVENDVMTISGERRHEHEHKKGGVYRCERVYGSFQRNIALPEGVTADAIQASFENGVLEVTMPIPKPTQSRGRQIPIRSKPATMKH